MFGPFKELEPVAWTTVRAEPPLAAKIIIEGSHRPG